MCVFALYSPTRTNAIHDDSDGKVGLVAVMVVKTLDSLLEKKKKASSILFLQSSFWYIISCSRIKDGQQCGGWLVVKYKALEHFEGESAKEGCRSKVTLELIWSLSFLLLSVFICIFFKISISYV
jgi:hypothetical protein